MCQREGLRCQGLGECRKGWGHQEALVTRGPQPTAQSPSAVLCCPWLSHTSQSFSHVNVPAHEPPKAQRSAP